MVVPPRSFDSLRSLRISPRGSNDHPSKPKPGSLGTPTNAAKTAQVLSNCTAKCSARNLSLVLRTLIRRWGRGDY